VTRSALSLTGIRKRYGDVVALDNVSLAIQPGTIHALLGENGAGKTTLMRIAFGLTMADDGVIHVDDVELRLRSPVDAIRAGIGMVQQHFTLVPAMTVGENVALGVSTVRRLSDETSALAKEFGLPLDSKTPIRELSISEQQRVELLKALSRGARVLILDEPTAALPPAEAARLLSWLREFRERGGSVVLITHKLREALEIADEITVLRNGALTWSGKRERATLDELIAAMLGGGVPVSATPVADTSAGEESFGHEAIAEATSLVVRDRHGVARLKDATVRVAAGEIAGVAGVDGSGSKELLLALAGRARPSSGTLRLPNDIGFVPDDRHLEALLLDQSIAANVALRGSGRRRGWQGRREMESIAAIMVATNGIRAPSVRSPVSALSGGNQQRLVLARELDGNPSLFVAINPARGLDVAATAEIHRRLRGASRAGMAVVYYSPDLDELLEISDRILVMFDGRVSEVPLDRELVGRAMLGAA
jgi:general nucleoside transport system ATP-binding protein